MKIARILAFTLLPVVLFFACSNTGNDQDKPKNKTKSNVRVKVEKTSEQWKKELSTQEYYVLREAGTERAYTGDLLDNKQKGLYTCAGCNNVLFTSSTKYESGTGWPSFYNYATDTSIVTDVDYKLGVARTEVLCAKCGGHLGHVFKDGPKPTGLRYCMNSVALDFVEK